ncbi:MAG: ubiquinol-cytochrome c reductase iron-sulfur subunit, partial [Deltaproteobacteria bacterium]|nr:ubiquinol-cytochrome c reductase iron-sulfur subunit [Deltaproteobacteria bacterium]
SEVPAFRDQETAACEKAPAVLDLSAKAHHLDNPDRRCFLKQITWGLSAASALAVGGVLATAAIGPSLQKSPETWVPLGRIEDFRPGKVTTVTMRYEVKSGFHKSQEVKPVMIARRPDVNNVVVFNTTCTHLGCTVHWDESKQLYLCACHGGIFDADGHVSAGPPPRPLDHHVFKVENGYLFVGVM